MTVILRLARSFVRQNRWLLFIFVLWPLVLGAFVWFPHLTAPPADVLEIVQQEILYGLVIVTFLASSAIHNEKRSRRILGVLSKAVSRTQYLLGFLTGAMCFAAIYFGMMYLSVLWLLGFSIATRGGLALCLNGMIAAIWAVSLSLLLSTFAYPFIAATLAAAAAFAPMLLADTHPILAPVASLIRNSESFAGTLTPGLIAIALIESALFLVIGEQVFSRHDVTANLE
jgi:hypothetical protein